MMKKINFGLIVAALFVGCALASWGYKVDSEAELDKLYSLNLEGADLTVRQEAALVNANLPDLSIKYWDTQEFSSVEVDTSDTETFVWENYSDVPMYVTWCVDLTNSSGTTGGTLYIDQTHEKATTPSKWYDIVQTTFAATTDTCYTTTLYQEKTRLRLVANATAQVSTAVASVTVKAINR